MGHEWIISGVLLCFYNRKYLKTTFVELTWKLYANNF